VRAHKVKCQICAKGVLVVLYTAIGKSEPMMTLVSGNLSKDDAIDLVARHLAVVMTQDAVAQGHQVAFTSEDVKFAYKWEVEPANILSHL
jgi:20S proteasome alpha/beta subunit